MERVKVSMTNIKQKLNICLVVAILFLSCSLPCVAAKGMSSGNTESYNYNLWGESIPAPEYYCETASIGDGLTGAQDIFVLNETMYVLNSGTNSILLFDIQSGRQIGEVLSKDQDITDGKGIFVTEKGLIYVALYTQKDIVVLDAEGTVVQKIGAPESDIIDDGFIYNPKKVVVQNDQLVYVVAEGSYQGIVQFDVEGNFTNFFGSNKVSASAKALMNLFWRKLFNAEQKDKMQLSVPVDYSSIAIDNEGFVYTVTARPSTYLNQVKKHSSAGNNILRVQVTTLAGVKTGVGEYGDLEQVQVSGAVTYTTFNDLCVDDDKIITALDTSTGRLFQYDSESRLLGIFGGFGSQKGTFQTPIAVEQYGSDVLVLDSGAGVVWRYSPTRYGAVLRQATHYHQSGDFLAAEPYWQEAYEYNGNLYFIQSGLGRAAMERGDYQKGMEYFLAAGDRSGYDECFYSYRTESIRDYFWIPFLGIIGIAAAVWLAINRSIRLEKEAFSLSGTRKLHPGHALLHPNSFEILKSEHRGDWRYALAVVFFTIVVRLLSVRYTGFLFNDVRPAEVNLLAEIFQILALFAAFVACSWAVGTFINGEGKAGELFIGFSYALTPYCVCGIIAVLLSNVLTLREGVFVSGVQQIGIWWSALLIFIAAMRTNRYSFLKTILSLLLTIVGMVFVLFICIMLTTLIGQLGDFIKSIYTELTFRM